MIELDKIYNEDCLKGMQRIPDDSVDAIICDLPYGVLNNQSEGGSWDCIIPFEPLWKQYLRVAKADAPIILFASGLFTGKLMMSQPKLWRYNLVWDKGRSTGFLNANRMPMRSHEDICVFYRRLPKYNPQMEDLNGREPSHPNGSGPHSDTNRCYGKVNRFERKVLDKKFPGSIISIKAVHCNEDQFHPTQKPVDLLRYLILTYTEEGGVILDSCMGSGTTAVAAIKEKRHFVGFETNKDYYEKAVRRVELAKQHQTLF